MIRTVVVALLGASLLTACGQPASPTPPPSSTSAPKQHVLELEVTGTATLSLTFTLDGQVSEEQGVTLPWSKKVGVPYGSGNHEWKLAMRHSGGSMAATATVDGQLVTQTAGSSSAGSTNTANLTGSFSD